MHPESTGFPAPEQPIRPPVSADAATSYNRCDDVSHEPRPNDNRLDSALIWPEEQPTARSPRLEPPSPAEPLSRAIYWLRRTFPLLRITTLRPGRSTELLAELTVRVHDITALNVQALWELRRFEAKRELFEETPREHAANALQILALYRSQNYEVWDKLPPALRGVLDAVAARLRLALQS